MAKLNLNVKSIAALRPVDKRVDYFDAGSGSIPGFHVRMTPTGEKTYSLLYRIDGHLRRLTIGNVASKDLKAARQEAKDALRKVGKGEDPAAEKQELRQSETFAELAELYLEAKKSKRSSHEDRRIVEVYLNPRFRHIKASKLSRSAIGTVLQEIASDAPVMANRVLACIRGIYNWAIGAGILESTPCVRLKAPGAEKKGTRHLSDEEIKKVWAALDASDSPVAADSFKLRLMTGQRAKEILGMAWKEVDMDSSWWTIPGERTKNGRPHRVYLSSPAMRILKGRLEANGRRTKRAGGPSAFVFPGRRKGKPLTETKNVLEDIRDASGITDWRGHDLRRTASTIMTRDLKISRFIVERVLNHTEDGRRAIEHYDMYEYEAEKKEALERLGKRIMTLVSNLKVAKAVAVSGPDLSAG